METSRSPQGAPFRGCWTLQEKGWGLSALPSNTCGRSSEQLTEDRMRDSETKGMSTALHGL